MVGRMGIVQPAGTGVRGPIAPSTNLTYAALDSIQSHTAARFQTDEFADLIDNLDEIQGEAGFALT